VHGGKVYVGDADLMEYKIFSGSGRLEKIIRAPGYDLRITPEDMVKEKAARLGPDPSPAALRGFSALSLPKTKPAYSDLLVSADGFVWTREYQNIWAERRAAPGNREPSEWTVFGPDGRWLGSILIPARFVVFEIGPDFVLGLGRDDLDVQHVQLLRLNRH